MPGSYFEALLMEVRTCPPLFAWKFSGYVDLYAIPPSSAAIYVPNRSERSLYSDV